MRFQPDAWDELVDDEEYNHVLMPILVLAQERDPDPDPEMPPIEEPITPEEREILVRAIGAAAPAIYDYFWEARQKGWALSEDDEVPWPGSLSAQIPYRRETPKVGRNDPCPCGSGKKYKRCCGKDG